MLQANKYNCVIVDSASAQAVSEAWVPGRQGHAVIYALKSGSASIPLVQTGVGKLLQLIPR